MRSTADGLGLKQYAIGPDGTYGTLDVQHRDPKPPRWAQFFDSFVGSDVFGWMAVPEVIACANVRALDSEVQDRESNIPTCIWMIFGIVLGEIFAHAAAA